MIWEGNLILTPLPQADGRLKNRPALILRRMPPFGDFLVCGISTQLHQKAQNFDEIISPSDDDFQSSGLLAESLIRLGFLAVLPLNRIAGGAVSPERHKRLLKTLGNYLAQSNS